MIRTYLELRAINSFVGRFKYLALHGDVGEATFGFDRWINQQFYRSAQWRNLRHHVLSRDLGCDLGVPGYEIHNRPVIHHMNPLKASDITHGDESILDPRFLISTSLQTHNAIHYGDERQLPKPYVPRTRGDTRLW